MRTGRYLIALGIWTAVLGIGLTLSLVVTSPEALGPVGVTIWFIAVLGEATGLVTLLLFGIKTFLRRQSMSAKRLSTSFRQGVLIGGWLTALLALASLRQLGVKDVVLLGLLLLIIEVYVRFRWP